MSTFNRVLQEFRNTASGKAIIEDWLGAGDVESSDSAEARAFTCSLCPAHRPAKWWESAKEHVADWIRRQLELKNQIGLRVSNEENLGMCSVCGCCIRLKVWTPMPHIAKHTSPETLSKFPTNCWIKHALK